MKVIDRGSEQTQDTRTEPITRGRNRDLPILSTHGVHVEPVPADIAPRIHNVNCQKITRGREIRDIIKFCLATLHSEKQGMETGEVGTR